MNIPTTCKWARRDTSDKHQLTHHIRKMQTMIFYVRADQSCKTVATRLEVKYLQASEHILQDFPLCLTEHRFLWPNSGSLQKKLGRSEGSFKWVFIVRTGLKIGPDATHGTWRSERSLRITANYIIRPTWRLHVTTHRTHRNEKIKGAWFSHDGALPS